MILRQQLLSQKGAVINNDCILDPYLFQFIIRKFNSVHMETLHSDIKRLYTGSFQFYHLIRLAASFKFFESQKYCAVEIVEEMRLNIYGKDQFWKNKYLITLKRIFVTGVMICLFLLRNNISLKSCLLPVPKKRANVTKQCNNIQLKAFRKVLFLVSKVFCSIDWLKTKTVRK